MISRRELLILLAGCCSMLTCETANQRGLNNSSTKRDAETPAAKLQPSDVAGLPENWTRRTLTDAKRVDPQVARLAVSTVESSDSHSMLRLDAILLGGGEWPAVILSHCGLEVRRRGAYLLVESRRSDGLKPDLRAALVPVQAAIDRLRGNLLTQRSVGQREISGELERLIGTKQRESTASDSRAILVELAQGSLSQTGHALDVAIEGQGLFVLEYRDGSIPRRVYTRDGRFKMRNDGTLVSWAMPQAQLIPEIVLPLDTTQVAVNADGAVVVRTKGGLLLTERGRIGLTWFEHPERLAMVQPAFFSRTPEAGNLVEGKAGEAAFGTLRQGYVEGGNVDVLENWTRLCLLEDARQLLLAMIAEADGASQPELARTGHPAKGWTAVAGAIKPASPMVILPLSEPGWADSEPDLLKFLRSRGVDAWAGSGAVELRRSPETAACLVDYLKFLRKRLDVLAENIANASRSDGADEKKSLYRRRIVRLRNDGEAEILMDTSPPRVAWEAAGRNSSPDNQQPRLVEYPNVLLETEMADADAVSREYRAIREALQEMGRDAVPALAAMLRGPVPGMRLDAAWALGQVGTEASSAVPVLVESLKSEDWELREAATSALQRIAPDSPVVADAVVQTWMAAMRTADRRQRDAAVAVLGRMGARAAQAAPLLAELVEDPTSGAARSLAQMGPAAAPAVPALTKALANSEVHVRQQAADALGRIGPTARPAVLALIAALKDQDAEVRWRAAVAIGQIGANDSGGVAALAALLKDNDAQVRDRVAEALGRIGQSSDQVRGLLEDASRAEKARDRVWPLFALALTGPRSASTVLALANMLSLDEKPVRLTVCAVLGRLGMLAKPAVPSLAELAIDKDDAVSQAAIEALGNLGLIAAEAVPTLSVALTDRNLFVRRRAAVALGQIGAGSSVAVPALVGRLSDDSEQVVAACIEALGRIGPQAGESVECLRSLQTHQSLAVRNAAQTALACIQRTDADGQPAKQEKGRTAAVAGIPEEAAQP